MSPFCRAESQRKSHGQVSQGARTKFEPWPSMATIPQTHALCFQIKHLEGLLDTRVEIFPSDAHFLDGVTEPIEVKQIAQGQQSRWSWDSNPTFLGSHSTSDKVLNSKDVKLNRAQALPLKTLSLGKDEQLEWRCIS